MRGTTLTSRPAAPEAAALAAIDRALATAPHRSAFSRDEAAAMFHGVCVALRDPTTCAAVRSVLDDALPLGGTTLVERSRVVDVLLDARLLVTAPE
jgi:hypothetical protein